MRKGSSDGGVAIGGDAGVVLRLLPVAIATLIAALSPEDQEVLAYFLTCSPEQTNKKKKKKKKGKKGGGGGSIIRVQAQSNQHQPMFRCSCFQCYKSFWTRWDSSSSRDIIHQVIDLVEEQLCNNNKRGNGGLREEDKRVVSNGGEVVDFVGGTDGDNNGGDGCCGWSRCLIGRALPEMMDFVAHRLWALPSGFA